MKKYPPENATNQQVAVFESDPHFQQKNLVEELRTPLELPTQEASIPFDPYDPHRLEWLIYE